MKNHTVVRWGGLALASTTVAAMLTVSPGGPTASGAPATGPSASGLPAVAAGTPQPFSTQPITAAQFASPPQDAKPATRWWWQAPLSLTESVREINAIAAAGYGEVEIAFSTGAWADQTQRDNLKAVLQAADGLGVKVSMTMGAAWPVQTPNTSAGTQYVQKELQYGYAEVAGGATFSADVPRPFDDPTLAKTNSALVGVSVAKVLDRGPAAELLPAAERPRFGTPIKIPSRSTILDQSSMQDVTAQVKDGKLTWTAPSGGQWMVFSYWQRDAAKAVTSAFEPEAAKAATEYLDTNQIGADNTDLLKKTGATMFEDSLELNADSLFWAPDFQAAFQKQYGYSLLTYLPLMYQHGMSRYWVPTVRPTPDFALADGTNQKVLNDYYTFINTEYIARTEVFQDWAQSKYGMKFKSQPAFGQDLEPIRAVREFARDGIQVEGESFNSGDRWPINTANWGWKFATDWQRVVASGAHQGGTNRVSTELGASREVTYELNLGEYKDMMDKEWAAGFTKPYLHGFAYQSVGSTWPGKQRFGDTTSESWNDSFPQWADMKALTSYWARGTLVLESGAPRVDVAIYRDDFLTTAARLNTDEGTNPDELFYTKALEKAGYSIEFADPVGLAEPGVVGNGVLFPNGPQYKAIVVDQRMISAGSAQAIAAAAASGVKVVFVGALPTQDNTFSSGAAGDQQVKAAVAQALASPNTARVETQGDVTAALQRLGDQPRASWSTGERVLTQTRQVGDTTYVYLYNTARNDITFSPSFAGTGAVSVMDLQTGSIAPADSWSTQGGRTTVPTTLPALGTMVYAIDSRADQVHVVSSTNPDDKFIYANGTITLRTEDRGTRTVLLSNGRSKTLTVRPADPTVANPGPYVWSLSVDAVQADGTYKTINVGALQGYNSLYDWRDLAPVKSESGVGTYTGTLNVPADWVGTGKGIKLDLGRVDGTARIFINGQSVGTEISEVQDWDVSPYLKAGANAIKIELRTTLRNAVTQYKGTAARTQGYGLRGAVTFMPYADAVVWNPAVEPGDATLTASAGAVSYPSPATVSVKVTAAKGTPSGTVTVSEGGKSLATAPVGADGLATVNVAGLAVGAHTLSVAYSGSADVVPATSSVTVTVGKASATLSADVTVKRRQHEVKLGLAVISAAPDRSGTLTVTEKGKKVGTLTVGASGKGVVKLKKVKPGKHAYTVSWSGNTTTATATGEVKVRLPRRG